MISDIDRDEIIAANISQRFYLRQLHQHPNCLDPDHPGCESCEPMDEEE